MKKGVKRKFNFSNKLSYSIIVVLAVLLVGVSVYAYGTSSPSTFGHSISEIDPPTYCGGTGYNDGYLVYQGGWTCVNKPTTTSISTLGFERVTGSSTGTYADAVCSSGKTAIGGGCKIPASLTQIASYPVNSGDRWRCSVSSNPSAVTLYAYAICATA